MDHGIDPAVVLLGLPGFRLLEMSEEAGEIVVQVETTKTEAWCEGCGVRAHALIKKIKRIGHGFRNFHNYKLRVLLYAGGVAWDTPSTVKLRGRRPRLVA